MGTVYITQNDAFIGKTDERLTVKADKKQILDVPMIKIDGVVILGRATLSPAVVVELLERKIPLSFMTGTGRYLGRLEPELTKNIFVRSAQWKAAGESSQALHVVRGMIRGKLKNYRNSLLRHAREHPDTDLQVAIAKIEQSVLALESTTSINSLRGLEGNGSAAYFSVFNQLVRADGFSFNTRNRRPPLDPINAMLSFGYSLLRHDIQGALNIVGFDPYLGYSNPK
jgi:CRISP-associated protein Cas1